MTRNASIWFPVSAGACPVVPLERTLRGGSALGRGEALQLWASSGGMTLGKPCQEASAQAQ